MSLHDTAIVTNAEGLATLLGTEARQNNQAPKIRTESNRRIDCTAQSNPRLATTRTFAVCATQKSFPSRRFQSRHLLYFRVTQTSVS